MDVISAPELVLTEDQQRAKQEIEASPSRCGVSIC